MAGTRKSASLTAVEVGEWIKAERTKRGWSQDELAHRAHIGARLVGRYERGEGEPSIETLTKIADAFAIKLPWKKG